MFKIYTVNEVAEILKVDPATIRILLRTQKLKGLKIGNSWRIEENELEAYLETLRGKAMNRHDDLQKIIDLVNEYSEKYSIDEKDKKEALIKIYALIPKAAPIENKIKTKKEKGEKDFYDMWIEVLKPKNN